MIQNDPEVAMVLNLMGERLREKGKEELAYKIENLVDLIIEELEAGQKKKL
jgi:hypothetical protein